MIVATSEWWAQVEQTGEGVLFRKGEQCVRCGPPYGHCPHSDPPAEFAEWAQPCETCGGRIEMCWDHDPELPIGDCLTCEGHPGKRRIAVAVPCSGEGIWCGQCQRPWRFRYCDPLHNSQRITCRFCGGGLVTVGHVVVESGPDLQDDGQWALGVKKVQP